MAMLAGEMWLGAGEPSSGRFLQRNASAPIPKFVKHCCPL
jgi:hypothetical protein